jgi:hypothetical protein
MSSPITLTAQRNAVGSQQVQKVNFLLRICRYCDLEFVVGPGDVLYGDRWHHGRCWEKLNAAAPKVSKTD